MNNSSVIKMIEDGLIFGDVVVPSDNYNFKKYRIAHKNEDGSNFTQVDCANMLDLSDDKVVSKFENNNSRIDDRTYSIFLLLIDKHPNYALKLKSDIKPEDAKLVLDTPSPEIIKAARESVSYEPVAYETPDSLKQNQISRLLGLHPKMFGKYESTTASDSNRRKPSPHTWTLFLLITKQHPYYDLVHKKNASLKD